jgi:RNA polymerase sigma-70 factor, ECF subfamily
MAIAADRLAFSAPLTGSAEFRLDTNASRARLSMGEGANEEDRLLARIAGGEATAFARLMEKHLDRAYALALRVTGSRADAEDVAQEAFLRVWRRAGDWQPGRARFSTWLYRVVMNLCLDRRRKTVDLPIEPWIDAAEPRPNAEAMLLSAERDSLLLQAMAALPERQRQAMALCYTLDLSNAEAAETMEISVKAYEALLVRAKQAIRVFIKEQA